LSGASNPEFINELFAGFGPVTVRRMFSGAGVFADGLMIALVVRGVIYLKADAELIPAFEREGLGPFSYKTKDGSRTLNSYWRMPERLYDDPDELAAWAGRSMAAARRADAHQRGRKSSQSLKRKKKR
jgi:DNA transformation protein and related proteins